MYEPDRKASYERREVDPITNEQRVERYEERVPGVRPAVPVTPVAPVASVAPVEPVYVAPYNYRAVQVVWFITALIATMIALRFVLKLLGASPQASFVGFDYGITAPLVAPFNGIFPTSGQGFYIFEPASLMAIAIYALIGWGIVALIKITTAPKGTIRRPLA